MYILYNYSSSYKNSFVVRQYTLGYTTVFKINSDNCYIDSANLLLNYNLNNDANLVCKSGYSFNFLSYNESSYTNILELNTSNIICNYPIISNSTLYTNTINYNSAADLNIFFNLSNNINFKNGSTNYLQINNTYITTP